MASRKGRAPRGTSIRNRPGSTRITRTRSYEDPERFMREAEVEIEIDRPTQLKNCCRSVATFMFTQVGVGGIIVGYAIVGAFAFISLETGDKHGDAILNNMRRIRLDTAGQLWTDYDKFQYNSSDFNYFATITLKHFQDEVVLHVKKGYDGRTVVDKWNFPAALMFTLSIFTMIGYGNLVPRTDWGKVITICYAVFGIPLYVLYFLNMGRALARIFKWMYIKLSNCKLGGSKQSEESASGFRTRGSSDDAETLVPSSASVYVLIAYISIGTIMFAEWEDWGYLDSVYFCVISLCKIGLGDFVPGTQIGGTQEGNQRKLVINFVYLLLGLGLVAMCYNLLKEEVLAKLKQIKADVRDFCLYARQECSCR